MKKLVALSVCLSASTILLAASPSFSQTVTVPITGTTIGLNVDVVNSGAAFPNSFIVNTTLLTPLGAVSVSEFNGSISTTAPLIPSGLFNVVASQISFVSGSGTDVFLNGYQGGPLTTFIFVGTTNGTAPFVPNNAFTNAPTTIKATFDTAAFAGIFPAPAQVNVPITGGSITLPAPPPVVVVTCTDCLNVIPDLRISNSTFLSPASQQPEYRQEYSRNNFSTSSFDGGRVLGLENK